MGKVRMFCKECGVEHPPVDYHKFLNISQICPFCVRWLKLDFANSKDRFNYYWGGWAGYLIVISFIIFSWLLLKLIPPPPP